MEEKEKLPWKPPEIKELSEIANLPDPLAYFLESYGDIVQRTHPVYKPLIPNPPENGFWWKKEKPLTATELETEAQWKRLHGWRFAEPVDPDELEVAKIVPYMQREMDMMRNQVIKSCAIPGEILFGDIYAHLGIKEDKMDRSLAEKHFKKVTIECEDGSTYAGKITHVCGSPYRHNSLCVEAMVEDKPIGAYGIEKVVFQNPATIVYWSDGTKTVVNCMDNVEIRKKIVDGKEVTVRKPRKCDTYSEENGLAMAIVKKWAGNVGNYNDIFRKFIPGMAEAEKVAKKAAKKAKKEQKSEG